MKTRIKMFLLLVALCGVIHTPIRGQLIVNDPIHTGSNLIQFLQALSESIVQTARLTEVFNVGIETVEAVQRITHLVEDVNSILTSYRQVEGLVLAYADILEISRMGVEHISRNRNQVDLPFATDVLNHYTRLIAHSTRVFSETSTMLTPLFRGSDAERMMKIEQGRHTLDSLRNISLDLFGLFIEHQRRNRELEALSRGLMEAHGLSSAQAITIAFDSDLHSGALAVLAMQEEFFQQLSSQRPVRPRTITFREHIGDYLNLYFGISAIVLLFGAYKVFERVMLGEDLLKSLSIWAIAAVVLVLIGIIVNSISFGMR